MLIGVFLSGAYNFFLYSETQHGLCFSGRSFSMVIRVRNFLRLGLCFLPGVLSFFLLPFFFCL